jgi:hypothetical protein
MALQNLYTAKLFIIILKGNQGAIEKKPFAGRI